MLRISLADVLLSTLTTRGRPVRKATIQLQREMFGPRVLSLVISFADVACNQWLLVGICMYGHCGDDVVDALIDEAGD